MLRIFDVHLLPVKSHPLAAENFNMEIVLCCRFWLELLQNFLPIIHAQGCCRLSSEVIVLPAVSVRGPEEHVAFIFPVTVAGDV